MSTTSRYNVCHPEPNDGLLSLIFTRRVKESSGNIKFSFDPKKKVTSSRLMSRCDSNMKKCHLLFQITFEFHWNKSGFPNDQDSWIAFLFFVLLLSFEKCFFYQKVLSMVDSTRQLSAKNSELPIPAIQPTNKDLASSYLSNHFFWADDL